jgi:magnesium chelatase family protein
MPCLVTSGALVGVQGVPVRVEVETLRRLPATQIVGMAVGAVQEAAERVRSAIHALHLEWPRLRVIVNLAPADLRKDGTAFDLPIALGVLAAMGYLDPGGLEHRVVAGELSLGGELRIIRGALSLALMARDHGFEEILLPRECAAEAAMVDGIRVVGARDLAEVVEHISGREILAPTAATAVVEPRCPLDLAEVRGQHLARRALEIAAAGGHNLLMIGPPGCGKTMLASRLPTILPEMAFREAIEATRIHSVAGLRPPEAGMMSSRPFRAPHHSISSAGMLGSAQLRPGEASLAHAGVLFLDELPEFQRNVLELLRGPLESREIVISRALGTVRFPASFSLVAAANPCPCGFRGHARRPCACSEESVHRYMGRMSGPLLDRIDMVVELAPIATEDLVGTTPGEASERVRERVVASRELQRGRYRGTDMLCNADLSGDRVRAAADPVEAADALLRRFVDAWALSGRAHSRLLKVARTLADLEGAPRVEAAHVAEAMQFRGWDQPSGALLARSHGTRTAPQQGIRP